MLLRYKQYMCSQGCVITYENGSVEFIPWCDEIADLDFNEREECELVDEGEEEFTPDITPSDN